MPGAKGSAIDDSSRLAEATDGLRRRSPELSAGEPSWRWQRIALATLPAAIATGAVIDVELVLAVVLGVLALPFFCVVAVRALALWDAVRPAREEPQVDALPDSVLPTYTVLVPLFRETDVVADLVTAMRDLDYPADKLEILLAVEAADHDTRAAVAAAPLASHMRVVVVPEGAPRTKPRALNFALAEGRGDVVTVYDAEDVPEPDQLRRAAAVLRADPRLGCVQARLNIYNGGETWLTRQFTIEYTALFDRLLPTFARLRLPVPLGGTSNHFPRRALEDAGLWDPYNVTEDADLGLRLERRGWRTGVLASTTWEEAPDTWGKWLGQRTRWLKGWMQTYLVHMRDPPRLARELGARRFIGLQVLMGGMILSSLVHPWFYVLAALEFAGVTEIAARTAFASPALWWLGVVNLVMGYGAGIALGVAGVLGRNRRALLRSVPWMPLYWLLISYAAYRALWQLAVAPHLWEKTQHRARTGAERQAAAPGSVVNAPEAAEGTVVSG